MVANSITSGLFGSNLPDFITGRTDGVYRAGADGSNRLTLPELLGISGSGGVGGTYGSGHGGLMEALEYNLKKNFGKMMVGVIVVPMVAQVATKVLRKPVIQPANKLLKMTGLNVKV